MATETKPSFWDNLGNIVLKAGETASTVFNTYVGAQQRLLALKSMQEDSQEPAAQPAVIAPQVQTTRPAWVLPAVAVGLVLVGVFVAKRAR